jgi:hypothetical protein
MKKNKIKQIIGMTLVIPLCLMIWDIQTLKDVIQEVKK